MPRCSRASHHRVLMQTAMVMSLTSLLRVHDGGPGRHRGARLNGPSAQLRGHEASLDDHVAEIDPDAELDALLLRHTEVAPGHALLHLDRATHGFNHARELDQNAVAGQFDDVAVMLL